MRQFGVFTDPAAALIDQIAAAGVGGVSMGPYFVQPTSLDSSLGALNLGGAAPYVEQMRRARARGLRVTLKPIVDAAAYPNHPGRDAYRAYLDPVDPAAWFADYWERAVRPYLEWSDTVVIYTETETLSAKYPNAWRELVGKVRAAGFTGPIVSDGGQSDLSRATTPWIDVLSWVGASFYPTIDAASDAAATAGWRAVAEQMATAHAQSGLPVFMSEVGVFNLPDTQTARWIEVMGDVLGPEPWWAGFIFWRWTQDPAHPPPAAVQAALRRVATRWASTSPA